ncbi:MAG: 16S rRNA (cytosine(1402)-N(4))-methyltransferase RsmH, partial [Tepidiformaceae bacterium]
MRHLGVRPAGRYLDCTTGLGGHSTAIAQAMGEDGRLLCIDQDSEALRFARTKLAPFGRRVSFVHGNFRELATLAAAEGFEGVDGIVMDLGVSSLQFDQPERGFAFGAEGPLDMRMDRDDRGLTAAEIVNSWDETSLANLFYTYGEERQSRRIAASVVRARPLSTTWDLARAVEQAVGGTRGRNQIHPATRVFLALRIRINGELDSLEAALPQAHSLLGFGTPNPSTGLEPGAGGRLAVISFHSLEDRIVKQYFRRESAECICPPELPVCRCGHRATLREVVHRAIRPTETEVARNPRARSAVLRVVERLPGTDSAEASQRGA